VRLRSLRFGSTRRRGRQVRNRTLTDQGLSFHLDIPISIERIGGSVLPLLSLIRSCRGSRNHERRACASDGLRFAGCRRVFFPLPRLPPRGDADGVFNRPGTQSESCDDDSPEYKISPRPVNTPEQACFAIEPAFASRHRETLAGYSASRWCAVMAPPISEARRGCESRRTSPSPLVPPLVAAASFASSVNPSRSASTARFHAPPSCATSGGLPLLCRTI